VKIFLDANIFLRFLVPENPSSHKECESIFNLISQSKLIPYTSPIVLLEVVYTLQRTYKRPKTAILSWLADTIKLRNLTIIDKTITIKALQYYQKYNIKLGDCYIATQIPPGCTLCTYDTDFSKLPFLKVATPDMILTNG
jgi:predicted nucleic acid-binding protein